MSGLGLRVGLVAMGDGEGVRASGESGILCTDLRRLGDFVVCCCILCCNPCSERGRELKCAPIDDAAGELGMLDDGELLLLELAVELAPPESEPDDHTRVCSGGDRGDMLWLCP